jgi:hypothetical protein
LDIVLLTKTGFPYEKVQAMSEVLSFGLRLSNAGPKVRVAGEDFA